MIKKEEEESLNPSSRTLIKQVSREESLERTILKWQDRYQKVYSQMIADRTKYEDLQSKMFFVSVLLLIAGLFIGIFLGARMFV